MLFRSQETQVKSSGIEAEFGGATGGVINVVTRGGGNVLHGEFGVGLRSSRLEPIAGPTLRSNNGFPEYYPSRRDQYNETNPTANLGGPIWKDHAWFFASYAPQIFTRERTLHFTFPSASCGVFGNQHLCHSPVETYNFKQRKEAALARMDGIVFNKLNLHGTFSWNPITQEGVTPSYSRELSTTFAGASTYVPTGGRQNSMMFTAW